MKDNYNDSTRDKGNKEWNNKEFNWRMAEFDKRFTTMEMERKGKRKDAFVEKLL